MTLVEQIRDIHAKHFNPEFHEYRGTIYPAMVNDLKMKFFDDLLYLATDQWPSWEPDQSSTWWLDNARDYRAVRKASELIQSCGLRDNIPSVD